MHWNSGLNAGFSTAEPWIIVNPNYREINAEEQTRRDDSVFAYYKTLIQFRKNMDIITLGAYELLLPDDPDLFAYTRVFEREELLVVCNFSREEKTFTPPERFTGAAPLVSNENVSVLDTSVSLGPFGAVVYYKK
jgi:oligo-1,6-glucosidase